MTRTLIAFVTTLMLVVGCENPESIRVEEVRTKLVGTWLREAGSGTARPSRVLTLGVDGRFTERLQVTTSEGRSERLEYAGEWSYDGANLKRRFMQENGRQFSGGRIRYATFALVSAGPSEFVVNDNIEGRNVTYRRVSEGTQP